MVEIDDSVSETASEGPGERLKKARRDAGFSVDEIAGRLHLSPSVVRQLEADQFDESIPDAFARGYLRNYAKLLELEPQEIIALYSQRIGSSMVKNYYAPSTTISQEELTQSSIGQWLPWGILVVALIATLFWYLNRDTTSAQTDTQLSQVEQNNGQQPDRRAIDNTDTSVQADLSEPQEQLPETLTNDVEVAQLDSPIDSQDATADVTTQPEANTKQVTIPTGFMDTSEAELDFDFLDDCWVSVTDANGEVLAVGLKAAGRSFQVSGMAPISVVLGKPRAVSLSFNQEPVALDCFPASSTARFELNDAQACGS